VAGAAARWRLDNLWVHDTHKTNDTNQDHLIYANTPGGVNGRIRNCLLTNSPNGRAVKLGPPSESSPTVSGISVEYCTMVNNLGPSNVQPSYKTEDCHIFRNIMVKPGLNRNAVTHYKLAETTKPIYVEDNIWWDAKGISDVHKSLIVQRNYKIDPQFDEYYIPQNPQVNGYGYRL
jgi:hypothetical protein